MMTLDSRGIERLKVGVVGEGATLNRACFLPNLDSTGGQSSFLFDLLTSTSQSGQVGPADGLKVPGDLFHRPIPPAYR